MFSDRTNWKLAHNRLTQAVEEAREAGAALLDLTVSNPTRVGLQYDSSAILSALSSERSLDYDPQSKGGPALVNLSSPTTATNMESQTWTRNESC